MGCACSTETSNKSSKKQVRRRRRRNSEDQNLDPINPPSANHHPDQPNQVDVWSPEEQEACESLRAGSLSQETNPLGTESMRRRRRTLPNDNSTCEQPIVGPTPVGSCDNSSNNSTVKDLTKSLSEGNPDTGSMVQQPCSRSDEEEQPAMNFFQPLSVEEGPSASLRKEDSIETRSPSHRRSTLAGSQDIPRAMLRASTTTTHQQGTSDTTPPLPEGSTLGSSIYNPPSRPEQRTMTLHEEVSSSDSTAINNTQSSSDTHQHSGVLDGEVVLHQQASIDSVHLHQSISSVTPPGTVASSLTGDPRGDQQNKLQHTAGGGPPQATTAAEVSLLLPAVTVSQEGIEDDTIPHDAPSAENWSFYNSSVLLKTNKEPKKTPTEQMIKPFDDKDFHTPPTGSLQRHHFATHLSSSELRAHNSNNQLSTNSSHNSPIFPSAPTPHHVANGSINGRSLLEKSAILATPQGVSEAAERIHSQLHEASRFRFRPETSTFTAIYQGGCKFLLPQNKGSFVQVATKREMLDSEELEISQGLTNAAGSLMWPAPRSIVSLASRPADSTSPTILGSGDSSNASSTASSPNLGPKKIYDVLPFTAGWEELQNKDDDEGELQQNGSSRNSTPIAQNERSWRNLPPAVPSSGSERNFHPRGSFHSINSAQSTPVRNPHPAPTSDSPPRRTSVGRSSLLGSTGSSTPLQQTNPASADGSDRRDNHQDQQLPGLPSFKLPQAMNSAPLQQEQLNSLPRDCTSTPPSPSLIAPAGSNQSIFAPPVHRNSGGGGSTLTITDFSSLDGSGGSGKLQLPPPASTPGVVTPPTGTGVLGSSTTSGGGIAAFSLTVFTKSDTIQSIDAEDCMKLSFADSSILDQVWAQGPDAYSGNFILVPVHLLRSPETLPGVKLEELVTERRAATRHILDTIAARLDELDAGDYGSVRRYAQRHLTTAQRTGLRELESAFTMLLAVLMDLQALEQDPNSFHELVAQSPGAHFLDEFVEEQQQQSQPHHDDVTMRSKEAGSDAGEISSLHSAHSSSVSSDRKEGENEDSESSVHSASARDVSSFPAYLQDRFRHDALYCLLAAHLHSRVYLAGHSKPKAPTMRKIVPKTTPKPR